jgi:membrane dipeptidase
VTYSNPARLPPEPILIAVLIVDAHLDLSMNALEWNRDFTRPIEEIRAREQALTDKPDRGRGTVTFPEMRRGGVGLCVATLIARYVAPRNPLPGWHSQDQAWAQTQGQLAWYRAMEERGELVAIRDRAELERHVGHWNDRPPSASAPTESRAPTFALRATAAKPSPEPRSEAPIGYVLSLEGADSIRTPQHLERAYAQGLRAVGPAHYGPGVYAQGTNATGVMGPSGHELLREMERLGIILDATHLCDDSFRDALDHFRGPVWASHSNCRALVDHNRQFSDDQLRELIARGAVIGAAFDAWMIVPNWVRGTSTPQSAGVTLERVIDHIDHICQIAGNARHCMIGSDLDGAFGREQCPSDVDTIADLAKIPDLLRKRSYTEDDVRGIMHGNFLRFLRDVWG